MKIGDLSAEQRRILQEIWDSVRSPADLPKEVCDGLAAMDSDIAGRSAPGSAQAKFNQARARYLRGVRPNPGRSVNDFADRLGIPNFRRRQGGEPT